MATAPLENSIDRMGAFDAVMWGVEDDPILRSVILSMVLLDCEPDFEVLYDRVDRMTLAAVKLRQRVIGNPMSLIPPRWETDPNFDLGFHIRRYQVSPDKTLRPVLRIAEQMAEQDFDRDRPLWEMAIVSGFSGEQTAVIMKIHHAITDGVGGIAMAAALFDLTREPDMDLGPRPPEPEPDVLDAVGRVRNGVGFVTRNLVGGGLALGRGAVGLTAATVTHPKHSVEAGTDFASSASRLLAPASEPLSPLMRKRSLSTHLAVLAMPFRALKAAGKANGCTLNDAYMAAVAGAIRSYHDAHLSPADEVRVNMPVNLRPPEGSSAEGGSANRWVPARFPMPIAEPDPVARMRQLSPILKQARTEPALAISDTIYRVLAVLPRSVTTSITAGMMKGCDIAVTNIPGPPIELYSAGARVDLVAPFAPKAGAAINVALMTYNGQACVGVNIDTRAVPDPEALIEHLVSGFDEILALGDPQARAHVVTAAD